MTTTSKVLFTISVIAFITILFGISSVKSEPLFSFRIGPNGFSFEVREFAERNWTCRKRARQECLHWKDEYNYTKDRWYIKMYKSCKANYHYMCMNT